jgi:ADP-heptose:LPS heptosyltransferase
MRTPYLKYIVFLFEFVMDVIKFCVFNIFDWIVLPREKPVYSPAVLIIRLDAIGDYLLFRPFIEQIKKSEKYKDRRIVLCGNIVWKELAEHFDAPYVDKFIWVDRKQFAKSPSYRYRKLKEITATGYESAISPAYSRDLFYADRMIKAVSAKEKIGSVGDPGTVGGWKKRIGDQYYTTLVPAKEGIEFELYRNQEFCEKLLSATLAVPDELIPQGTDPAKLELPANYAVLFISVSSKYRKWPLEYFIKVGEYLANEHGLDLVVCGGREDMEEARKFTESYPGKLCNRVGRTSLLELLTIISGSRILISNETVASHFAALLKTPCVVVYNGNNYGRFTPYPGNITDNYHIVHHPEIARDPENYKLLSNHYGYYNVLDISVIPTAAVIKKVQCALKSSEPIGHGEHG